MLMSRRAKDRMDKTNLIKKHGQNHAIKNSVSDLLKRPTVQKHTLGYPADCHDKVLKSVQIL